MKPIEPIDVVHLFPEVHAELLNLLRGLTPEQWAAPTTCEGWSVKDVALHLLDGDVGVLSSKRDVDESGYLPSDQNLVAALNRKNQAWVQSTRQLSGRVIIDLIEYLGGQAVEYWQTVDLFALNGIVSWAGPERAPQWLDAARHYTEKWHHQQHIRDAVGKPGLKEARFLHAVLDTFVRALPHTFRDTHMPVSTVVQLSVEGETGGHWFLLREEGRWTLHVETSLPPAAVVRLDADSAWRLFTKGMPKLEASKRAVIEGDSSLGDKLLDTISIIA